MINLYENFIKNYYEYCQCRTFRGSISTCQNMCLNNRQNYGWKSRVRNGNLHGAYPSTYQTHQKL